MNERLAAAAYNAYCTISDEDIVEFFALSEQEKAAWIAAALAVWREVENVRSYS